MFHRLPTCIGAMSVAAALFIGGPASAETPLERGAYLVKGIAACGNCHTPFRGPMKGTELAGGRKFGNKKAGFIAYAANITPDRETGIGGWTDGQIIRAIREGVRPDGSFIGRPMPIEIYRDVSDDDLKAIVAYLRSVPAVRNKVPKSTYITGKPKGAHAVGHVATVPTSDRVAYGKQLVAIGHCMECHTTRVRGRLDTENMLGAGGTIFRGGFGKSVSANITPDRETGIGAWSDDEIKRAITRGIGKGKKLKPPMAYPYYRKVKDEDLDAVIAYLRSIKPVRHSVKGR